MKCRPMPERKASGGRCEGASPSSVNDNDYVSSGDKTNWILKWLIESRSLFEIPKNTELQNLSKNSDYAHLKKGRYSMVQNCS